MAPKKKNQKNNVQAINNAKAIHESMLALPENAESRKGLSGYSEVQQNEYLTTEAIYPDEFERVRGRKDAWKNTENLAFRVKLASLDDPDYSVKLEFEFPKEYPKVLPKVQIISLQPDDPALKTQVEHIVKTYPNLHLGSESVHEVTGAIIDILPRIALSRAAKKTDLSLEEERIAKDAAEKLKIHEEQELAKRQQAEETNKTQQLLASRVEHERQRRKAMMNNHLESMEGSKGAYDVPNSPVRFDQSMICRDIATENPFKFRAVEGRSVILRRKDKTVTIVTPCVDVDTIQTPQLLLKDIYLPENLAPKNILQKTMEDIEELLESSKQHRHQNVVDLLGYRVDRLDLAGKVAEWKLAILSEYANKGSLSELLDLSGALSATRVRNWSHQLLEALSFFDKQGYVHPAIHLENCLLFLSPQGGITMKLSDGYGTALRNLVIKARDPDAPLQSQHPFWMAPELSGQNPHRNAKTCIWDLGIVILQMAFGRDVTTKYTSPSNCMEANEFEIPFLELLRMVFQRNPDRRQTAYKLQSARFYHTDRDAIFRRSSPNQPGTPLPRRRQSIHFQSSRWETDWEEIERMGKGGFGQVVKARNRTDGQIYAVKIVSNDTRESLLWILDEVRLLSTLNHPAIVRYYHTWYEKEQIEGYGSSLELDQQSKSSDPRQSTFTIPDTGHDPMDPSIYRQIGPEFSSLGFGPPSFHMSEGDDQVPLFASNGVSEVEGEISSLNSSYGPRNQGVAVEPDAVSDIFERGNSSQANGNADSSPSAMQAAGGVKINDTGPRLAKIHRNNVPERSKLYIVMELCEKRSLRGLIAQGLTVDVDTIWRLFRRIVSGLANIHGQGIMHRDLKPENIFLDDSNNPKIGDFGLATTGYTAEKAKYTQGALVAGSGSIDVGTPLYTAPEIQSGGSGKYTYKIDMYSLGIMFFEMNYHMPYAMQRYDELKKIRRPEHVLPDHFNLEPYKAQGEIILRLIDHNQDHRPSAAQLLDNENVPEPLEDEKIQRYIDRMAESDPMEYRQLIARLLDKPNDTVQDLAWDDKADRTAPYLDPALSITVSNRLESIFRRHGAIELSRETLLPKSNIYSNVPTFLDASGLVLQLPFDLTLPFARMIAQKKPEYSKTYCFGTVYRKGQAPGDEPIQVPEADFDFVSHSAKDLPLKEAEVIKVLDEVLTEFPAVASRSWTIILNHADLLELILDFSRVKKQDQNKVKMALSQLNVGSTAWPQIREVLRSTALNIPETSVTAIARFDFKCNFEQMRGKMSKILDNEEYENKAFQILARIEEVVQLLYRMNVRTDIQIAPLSNISEQLYRGSLLFQCVENSTRKMLAVGGRYDATIQDYQTKNAKGSTRAVGFRLNVLDLASYVRSDIQSTLGIKSARSTTKERLILTPPVKCDVLVTSFDLQTLSTACLDCVSTLWEAAISAHVTEPYGSMEELDMAYKNLPQYWTVIVKGNTSFTGDRMIKLRSPSKEEIEVRFSDLPTYLKQELSDRVPNSQIQQGTKLGRTVSSGPSTERNGEVTVLTPKHRNKKVNRAGIVAAVGTAAKGLADNILSDSPIMAVDTSDEVLQHLRNTRLTDETSWRTLRGLVPLQDRQYFEELQEVLHEQASLGKQGSFICNYKTMTCIYYDFGRVA